MQENAFQRVRNQNVSGGACPRPTWTVLAPSALGPPNLKHLPTALLGAIHTSELDRSEIDLSPKRSECERSNAN